jgi:hypothetical protein
MRRSLSLPRRQRKLIGAFAMLTFVIVYALLAMTLSQARPFLEASKLAQGIGYAILGMAWVIPMFPLIKWMEGGRDADES